MKHRILLITFCALFVTNCGEAADNTPPSPILLPHVKELLPLFGKTDILFPVYFGDSEEMGSHAGACRVMTPSRYPINIRINPKMWNKYSDKAKKALLLHELAHCLYGIKHTEKLGELMHPYTSQYSMCVIKNGLEECLKNTKVSFNLSDKDVQGAI